MARIQTEQELKSILVMLKEAYRRLEQVAVYEDLDLSAQLSLTEAAGSTFSAFANLREAIERQGLRKSYGQKRPGRRG